MPSLRIARHVQLLAALVASEVVSPLLAQANLVAHVASILLFGLVFLAVFRALFATRRRRWIGSILAGTTLAIDLARLFLPKHLQLFSDVFLNISASGFFIFVLTVILSHVFSTRQLRIDDVVGAFSGYIVIALLWGRLYVLTWLAAPVKYIGVARSDVRPILSGCRGCDDCRDEDGGGAVDFPTRHLA